VRVLTLAARTAGRRVSLCVDEPSRGRKPTAGSGRYPDCTSLRRAPVEADRVERVRTQFWRGDFCIFFDFKNGEFANFDFANFFRFCFVFHQKSLRQSKQGQSSSRTSVQYPIEPMPIELFHAHWSLHARQRPTPVFWCETSFGEVEHRRARSLERVTHSAERRAGSGGTAPTCGTRETQSIQAQIISGTGGNDETPCVSLRSAALAGSAIKPTIDYVD